jgi:hypothetical protein
MMIAHGLNFSSGATDRNSPVETETAKTYLKCPNSMVTRKRDPTALDYPAQAG